MWYYTDGGTGRPVILLHALGMSHLAWAAVVPYLTPTRRVIAFDIAGFGRTRPLADGITPTVPHLVDALERSLRAIGIDPPVDMAGNSLGGWMALEAARRGLARTVVAISPAGLWERRPPRHVPLVLRALRIAATSVPGVVKRLAARPATRELLFAIPISPGAARMPLSDALQVVDDLANATAFEQTFAHAHAPFSGRDIAVPVTVAFGDRDRITTRSARRRDALPPWTRWVEPHGWGHVPMWTDPAGVAALILERSSSCYNGVS